MFTAQMLLDLMLNVSKVGETNFEPDTASFLYCRPVSSSTDRTVSSQAEETIHDKDFAHLKMNCGVQLKLSITRN